MFYNRPKTNKWKDLFQFHDSSMGGWSLQIKHRKSENILRGVGVRWGLGVNGYANPLNEFSTSVSSSSSFSYCMLECSYYIFWMSYSSTPVWKSIFYWERSVTEAKRKKDIFYQSDRTRVTTRQETVVRVWSCPWTECRQQHRTQTKARRPRKILSGNWKTGPPHLDCLHNDAGKEARSGKMASQMVSWIVSLKL